MEAWHFTDGMKLRDGTPLEVGRTYRMPEGTQLVMCCTGYHASVRLIDALLYAPGSQLSRVVLGGTIISDTEKAVASERTVLWTMDATAVLRRFAVECAYGALVREREAGREPDLRSWEAVAVAWRYRDDESEEAIEARKAAYVAAYDAAYNAEYDAELNAELNAEPNAALYAALDAVRAAARAAARDAAFDAVRATARAAARDATYDAVRAAALNAAHDVTHDMHSKRLEALVMEYHDANE